MSRKFITQRGATASQTFRRTDNVQRSIEIEYTIDEALEIFIRAKEAEGVRPRTIKDYRSHVKYLKEYLNTRDDFKVISDLNSQMIRDYIIYLKDGKKAYEGAKHRKELDRGLSPTTINIRLRTLKTMCSFWYAEDILLSNPAAKIKSLKSDEQDAVKGFTDEEIKTILTALDDRQYAEWRDKVLILLLLDTGIRITEATTLTFKQIDFKGGSITILPSVAKNRKGREVPVSREVLRELKKLHEESTTYFGHHEEIFMNAYGEPFTAETFRRRLHRLKEKTGLKKIHPHMFRHTFIRNYLLNGGDLFTVQKIVDHADIKTTRRYVQMEDEHIRMQHNKFSPVRRFVRKH